MIESIISGLIALLLIVFGITSLYLAITDKNT